MVTRAYFARRFLALKLLRGALVAGALYDAVLAVLLLWRPPPDWLPALWLAMLAALGVAAARDIRRYSAIVAVLIGGRALAAVILAAGVAATASPLPWSAAWSALLAVTLAAAWWPLRG